MGNGGYKTPVPRCVEIPQVPSKRSQANNIRTRQADFVAVKGRDRESSQLGRTSSNERWRDSELGSSTAVLHFEGVLYYAMGYPNDETLNAHPLYANGLGFYGFYVVENSPLIADLDRRNQVHE